MRQFELPSDNLFGVLVDPSCSSSFGLEGGGEWTLDPLGFLEIGADMDGRRELARVSGLPSSESLSPEPPFNLF